MDNESSIRKVTVRNPAGLHARPSLAVAQTVRRSQSKVNVRVNGRTADAGDILQLLSLGVEHGTELELEATGPDADAVLDSLVVQFDNCFGI